MTGNLNGVLQVAGNYRNQWLTINNAYITSTASADGSIMSKALPENDVWGLVMIMKKLASRKIFLL